MDRREIKRVLGRFKGLAHIGVAMGIGTALSGVFWFYMAALLGSTSYGELSFLIAIASIGSTVSMAGMGTTLIVYTAKEIKLQSTIYSLVLVIASCTTIVTLFLFENVGMSLYIIGAVIFGLGISEILGRKFYRKYSIYYITQKILQIVLAVVFYHIMGPEGILFGFALSYMPYCIRLYHGYKETRIDFALLRPRLRFARNNYITDLTRTFSQSTDKLLIGPVFGFAVLGNYHLGIQFLTLLGFVPSIVFQYVLPRDSSGLSNKKLKKITILLSVVLAVVSVIFGPAFIQALFPKYEDAIIIMQIVSVAIVPRTISYMYMSDFLAQEKNKFVTISSLAYLVVLVILIVTLGGLYQIVGISAAIVMASVCETASLYLFRRKLERG